MGIATGLIALATLGADGPAGAAPAPIIAQVRFLEMDGLSWRSELHAKLEPVARRGGATIWTAGREVVPALLERSAGTVEVPKVTADAGSPARIATATSRPYVARVNRMGDGPVGHASRVAFVPEIDAVPDGIRLQFAGRPVDQGVFARVAIEETRLLRLHDVSLREGIKPKDEAIKPAEIRPQYQVPEVAIDRVEGEWLIPSDGVLIVSLGVRSGAGATGEPSVRERLALVEAAPRADSDASYPVPTSLPPCPPRTAARFESYPPSLARPTITAGIVPPEARHLLKDPAGPLPPQVIALALALSSPTAPPGGTVPVIHPMPQVPGRGLPQGFDSRGVPVLPTLPEDPAEGQAVDESSEPRPTPQARPQAPSQVPDGLSRRYEITPDGPGRARLRSEEGQTKLTAGSILVDSHRQVEACCDQPWPSQKPTVDVVLTFGPIRLRVSKGAAGPASCPPPGPQGDCLSASSKLGVRPIDARRDAAHAARIPSADLEVIRHRDDHGERLGLDFDFQFPAAVPSMHVAAPRPVVARTWRPALSDAEWSAISEQIRLALEFADRTASRGEPLPHCIFDARIAPTGGSVGKRISIYIDGSPGPRKDDEATRTKAEVRETPGPSAERHTAPPCCDPGGEPCCEAPATSSCPAPPPCPAVGQSNGPEAWCLTLTEAIQIGLDNCEIVRTCGLEADQVDAPEDEATAFASFASTPLKAKGQGGLAVGVCAQLPGVIFRVDGEGTIGNPTSITVPLAPFLGVKVDIWSRPAAEVR